MRTAILWACLGLILSAPGPFAGVKVQHDPEADFAGYRTYAWHNGLPAAREQIQGFIVDAVDRELQAKGMTEVSEGEADLYLVTYAFGSIEMGSVGGFFRDPSWSWGIISVDVRGIGVGTLIVELVDVEANRRVWLAVADNAVVPEGMEKVRKKVQKVTKKMFTGYPPR